MNLDEASGETREAGVSRTGGGTQGGAGRLLDVLDPGLAAGGSGAHPEFSLRMTGKRSGMLPRRDGGEQSERTKRTHLTTEDRRLSKTKRVHRSRLPLSVGSQGSIGARRAENRAGRVGLDEEVREVLVPVSRRVREDDLLSGRGTLAKRGGEDGIGEVSERACEGLDRGDGGKGASGDGGGSVASSGAVASSGGGVATERDLADIGSRVPSGGRDGGDTVLVRLVILSTDDVPEGLDDVENVVELADGRRVGREFVLARRVEACEVGPDRGVGAGAGAAELAERRRQGRLVRRRRGLVGEREEGCHAEGEG